MKKNRIVSLFAVFVLALTGITAVACSKPAPEPAPTPETYTVTFMLNYTGAPNEGVYKTSDVTSGAAVGKPSNPTRTDGYTFSKWTEQANGTGDWNFTTVITADKTLYAQWTQSQGGGEAALDGITATPTKTTYTVGDAFDTAGMTVKAQYSDNSEKTLSVSEYTVSGYNMAVAGTYTVTVGYNGKEATFTITVKESGSTEEPELDHITVTPPTKTMYIEGDTFDTTGMVVTAYYDNDSDKTLASNEYEIVKNPNMSKAGTYTVTVNYQGKTDSFTVTVDEASVTRHDVTFVKNTTYEVTGMPNAQSVIEGETANEPTAPACKGFTFGGWYDGGTKWNFDNPVNADVTLTAKWTAKSYTVNYIISNADNPADGTYTATSGEFDDFTLNAPAQEHYTFDGWYKTSQCTGTKYTKLTYADITAVSNTATEFTFYGKFVPETYNISFDLGGSSSTYTAKWADGYTAPTSYSYGDTVSLPTEDNIVITAQNDPTKTYHFAGWKIDGRTAGDISATDFGDKAYVAGFSANPMYVVTYNYNYTDAPAAATRKVEENGTAPELKPTRIGYDFEGWYKEAACTDKFDFENETVTADIPLYANWTIKSYSVKFDANGGTLAAGASAEVKVNYKAAVTKPADPTRTGYTFAGWVTDPESETEYDFDTEVTSPVDLYAKWTINTYTVTFDANGGTLAADTGTATVEHGDNLIKPADPTRTGYKFEYWCKESAATTRYVFADETVTGEFTLYAKWTAVEYTIVYEVGDGEVNAANKTKYKVTDTEDLTLKPATAPDHYRFVMWSTALEGGDEVTDLNSDLVIGVGEDKKITLYAIYSDIYTVTFDVNGGTELDDEDATAEVKYGAKITAPEVSRAGYTFMGWRVQGGETEIDLDTYVMPDQDTTLVAQWHENPKNGTYLMGSMTNWLGTTAVQATLDTDPTKPLKKEYVLLNVELEKDAEFILATYDENGDITEYVKAPATFGVYGVDGIMTIAQSDADNEGKGNYCVTKFDEAYTGLLWKITLGVNERGENFVSIELLHDNSLRNPVTGEEDGSVNVVTPEDSVYYIVGNFTDGFKQTDAWAIKDENPYVTEFGDKFYIQNIQLKKLDTFKVFKKVNTTEYWYGGEFKELNKAISLSSNNAPNIDLGVAFQDGVYNIEIDLGAMTVTLYKAGELNVTVKSGVTVYVGDTIAKDDLTVTFDGAVVTDYTLIATASVSGADASTATIVYNGKIVALDYTATDLIVTDIEITRDPTKLTYSVGDSVNLAGIQVKVTYNKPDTTETVTTGLTATLASGKTYFTAAGTAAVTVSYSGSTATDTFDVTVSDKLTSVKITTAPSKTVYYTDDTALDLSDMVVTAYYNEEIEGATVVSRALTNTDYTRNTIKFDTTGEKTLTVTYGEKSASIKVTVNALAVTSVSADATAANVKKVYKLGESFVSAGIKVTATYNSGRSKLLTAGYTFAAGENLDGDSKFVKAGDSVTVTVTHTESNKTATFTVKVDPFTVTYDADGGALNSPATVTINTYGAKLNKPSAEPTREHYTFIEWQRDGTVWSWTTGVTSDMTLTAVWQAVSYKVTFDANGGTFGTEVTKLVEAEYNTAVTAPTAPTKTGSTFAGWRADGATVNFNFSTPITGDIMLKAQWTEKEVYTVTFVAATTTTQEVVEDETATYFVPEKAGHTFGEWQTDDGAAYDFDTPVTGDITLTATWTVNKHKVTFVYDDNNSTTKNNVEYGTTFTAPETTPSKTGHDFDGWYNGNAKWDFDNDTMPDNDLTLTAEFTKASYKVTFVNGADTDETTVEFEASIDEPTEPRKDGYTFGGWYNDGTKWDFDNDTMPASALTLTAKWDAITYHVELVVNGTPTTTDYTIEDMPIALDDATTADESKQFGGWYTDGTFDDDKLFGAEEIVFDDFKGSEGNTVKLYAKFVTKTFTVKFNANGGTLAAETQSEVPVEYGDTVEKPADPSKSGNEFLHWSVKGSTAAFDFGAEITADTELVAQWKTIGYVSGIYIGDTLIIELEHDTTKDEYSAKIVTLNPGDTIRFRKSATEWMNATLKGGSTDDGKKYFDAATFTDGGKTYSAVKLKATVKEGATFDFYLDPNASPSLWVEYKGQYVEPALKDNDGVYGATMLKKFEVHENGFNEVIAVQVEVSGEGSLSLYYNGAQVEIATLEYQSGLSVTHTTGAKTFTLGAGVYDFYYNYGSSKLWIEGKPDVIENPNSGITFGEVPASGGVAYLVGIINGTTDWDNGYQFKTTDNNCYTLTRIYLKEGDRVKIRFDGGWYGYDSIKAKWQEDKLTQDMGDGGGSDRHMVVSKTGYYTIEFWKEYSGGKLISIRSYSET